MGGPITSILLLLWYKYGFDILEVFLKYLKKRKRKLLFWWGNLWKTNVDVHGKCLGTLEEQVLLMRIGENCQW
jgi:hypothetical protein